MNFLAPHTIRVPKGLAAHLVSERDLHGEKKAYRTNRKIKTIAHFILLKNLTTSGKIQAYDYRETLEDLAEYCKCGLGTFRRRVKELEVLGLVKITASRMALSKYNMELASWQKLADLYDLPAFEFYENISYDPDDKDRTAEYILKAVEIHENQQSQLRAIQTHCRKNPEYFTTVKELLQKYVSADLARIEAGEWDYFQQKLLQLQLWSFKSFENGSKYGYATIHALHADINRSVKTIRSAHGYKSCLSVTYLRRQLERRNLAEISACKTTSEHRMRKLSSYYVSWSREQKTTTWHLPDQVTLTLFTKTEDQPKSA